MTEDTTILTRIRTGIVANLNTVAGLNVYTGPVGSPVAPCAYVLRDRIGVREGSAGTDLYSFRVQVLVAKTIDKQAQAKLDSYVDPGSPSSILKAIETGDGVCGRVTFGGAAEDAHVVEVDADAVFEQELGSVVTRFLGCEFVVEAYAPRTTGT